MLIIGHGSHPTYKVSSSAAKLVRHDNRCGSFSSDQHLKHTNFLCHSATMMLYSFSHHTSGSKPAHQGMRRAVRLSVHFMSAVRFRNAQSFCGETIWGTCAGVLKHFTNGQRRRASLQRKRGLMICHLEVYITGACARWWNFGWFERHKVALL